MRRYPIYYNALRKQAIKQAGRMNHELGHFIRARKNVEKLTFEYWPEEVATGFNHKTDIFKTLLCVGLPGVAWCIHCRYHVVVVEKVGFWGPAMKTKCPSVA